MSKAGRIMSINPPYAIPGGEVVIHCEGFEISGMERYGVYFGDQAARLVGASDTRILAVVPENPDSAETEVYLKNGDEQSEPFNFKVGKKLADDLHIVANPVVDPKDDSIILTRSGSRGQQLPATLFRLDTDGILDEIPVEILNPTGIAFDNKGACFVTNRADGVVCRIEFGEDAVPFSTELGIATGLAFDPDGVMYVGDRSGTIFRISDFGSPESFAVLEPSVSAYHLAFGKDGNLFVTAPGLSSFDSVYAIDKGGFDRKFYRGLGRPQGLAFDDQGDLYVAACLNSRRGIVKISGDGAKGEIFVAGNNVVGLCFTRRGEMIVATNEAVYSLPLGISGILLD